MKMNQNIFHISSGNCSGDCQSGAQPRIRSAFMRKDLLAIGLGMVLSGVTLFSSLAADTAVALRGHVPSVVAQGQAQAEGNVDSEQAMDLSIGFPLRNRETITNLLEQLYDPKSPNFGHYLTPQQFTENFGPTEQDYQAMIEFAEKNDLKVTRTHANRMLLNVSGRAADVERTFGVTLKRYQHPTESREFFAPDREPSVPAELKIQDISGLDNFRRPYPRFVLKPGTVPIPIHEASAKAKATGASPNIGSGPQGNYMGDDFRRAYVPGTALTGAGQTVALVQFDGYLPSDITAYETLTGRPNVPLQNVLIDGSSGIPTGNNGGGEVEVSLDIEMVISMAPGISKIIVYEGTLANFHPNDVLNQIAVDNAARQVSSSWGWNLGPDFTTAQIFQQMALQGQTYFNATGDSDAFRPTDLDNPGLIVEPSSSPFITQVGGTALTMNGNGTSYVSETVWNRGPRQDGVGSSGGISTFYGIPSWQTNINMAIPQGSTTKRNVPDVAMTAEDVLIIADGGLEYLGNGGTSCAAPLWGGFAALVNQQAAINGHPPVGFINPALYTIAASTNYANCFHDIVTGNNEWRNSLTLFSATTGYDLCTGLGTPNGNNLITALVALNAPAVHISPPPPPYATNLAAVSGGNPNGAWNLFIQDDAPIGSGLIANGWILSLTTADFVGTAGDLELLMTPTNSTAFVGQPVTFTLTVTNYGPSISTNVSVVDNLPIGATLVSTNATLGTVIQSGSTLIWNVGTLNANTGGALTITVQFHQAGSLQNSANADAGTPDPNPDEDFAASIVNVLPLSVTLTPSYVTSDRTFHISVPDLGDPNLTVVIQANTNLANTNWVNIYTSSPPINFVDPAGSNYVSRFYRALLVP
jgi:uncharacterized repeat protein (TIGR01451 family)